jgi:integrase/recombinase XerC
MLLDHYIKYISNQKRFSRHSITAYENDLKQYQQYINIQYSDIEINAVTRPMIRSWIALLINDKYSVVSVNRKLSAVKSYYRYLLINKHISVNPAAYITALKTPKRIPSFVEKNQMLALCERTEQSNDSENFREKRDKLIIEMFYQTGIRISELLNIKFQDIDWQREEIKILGKRNKERIIPISAYLISLISEYDNDVKKNFNITHPYLFVSNSGKKLYPKFAYRVVNFYLQKVTSLNKKSPHVLRHTFATHLLNNGADLNAIKELLGHANLSSTQVYTHNSITQLTNIYKLAHPRA